MKLCYKTTIHPQQLQLSTAVENNHCPFQYKITSLCYSPTNEFLAVSTVDSVLIYDDGNIIETICMDSHVSTKEYLIRGIQFNSDVDQPKLAVATDSALVVYTWSNKSKNKLILQKSQIVAKGEKSICYNYIESSSCSITSMVWPTNQLYSIVYGTSEGNTNICHIRPNKVQNLHKIDSYVVSLASCPTGDKIISAHLDGSIYKINLPSKQTALKVSKIIQHSYPSAIAWGKSICIGSNDQRVVFYNEDGAMLKFFDYTAAQGKSICKEFTTASFTSTGTSVVVGNFNCFYSFSWIDFETSWVENDKIIVDNMHSVTALSWKRDETSLSVGTSCGVVDIYDACIRKYRYKDFCTVTYVSPSQVLIQGQNGNQITARLNSEIGKEILNISFFKDRELNIDRFIVARTENSLILCDLDFPTFISEIQWTSTPSEKNEHFVFDFFKVCIVDNFGELSIIELGKNEILDTIRSEYVSVISVRINESHNNETSKDSEIENKKIAYLLDSQTICVKDMITQVSTIVPHNDVIDFVEINVRGSFLLFRDKKRLLILYDMEAQVQNTLLNECGYVQWVPDSDVIVAQNRSNMCIWYNSKAPDQVTIREINGEVEGIERISGKTEVIVNENEGLTSYLLVEELIEFGAAIDTKEHITALQILESMEVSPQSEIMWQQLLTESIDAWNFFIAERCAAALGNVSLVRFLHQIVKIAESSSIDVRDNYQVKGKMLQLKKQLQNAENLYLTHNKIDEAIEMYEELSLFDDAIRVAERNNHPEVENKKKKYYQWLLDTKQHEKAAVILESQGDLLQAITLYLNAGLPGKAASVIFDRGLVQPTSLLESVATSLMKADMFEKAGDVYRSMGHIQKSFNIYIEGNIYQKAVEMARTNFPDQVVLLEESWGDHLLTLNQIDFAIDHFIQAHSIEKAIDAAMSHNRWNKAATLVDGQLNESSSIQYYEKLALHYASSNLYDEAERYFVKINKFEETISMYIDAGLWDKAFNIARSYLSEEDVVKLQRRQDNLRDSQRCKKSVHL